MAAQLRSLFAGFETVNAANLSGQRKFQNIGRDYEAAVRRLAVHGLAQRRAGASPVQRGVLAAVVPTVYVSNGREGTVTPIATATNTPGPPIPVGWTAGKIPITPDGKTAYGTSDDAVVPIATETNTAGPPIRIGGTPGGIVITPDGKTVYVASIRSGTVVPIATETSTAGPPIPAGARPRAIVITPDGTTAYVANQSRPRPRDLATAGDLDRRPSAHHLGA